MSTELGQMEGLYFKLYEKYSNLRKTKLSEMEAFNNDQDDKFINYVNTAEELLNHLKNENASLTNEVSDLKNEVASIRSTSDQQCEVYQKLYMEEKEKNNSLSEEVDRLQNLYQQEPSSYTSIHGKSKDSLLRTPQVSNVGTAKGKNGSGGRITRSRNKQARLEAESGMSVPVDKSRDILVEKSVNQTIETATKKMSQLAIQPECCQSTIDKSGGGGVNVASANCPFHDLIEYLMGMKLSAVNKTEGTCISVVHQSSGYSFSLTWVNKEHGEEPELLYRVSSLGTFERVAPKWMREDLMFSPRMCPTFFKRIASVIKLHH
ncbi:hypothetical protein ACFE04_009089 [Oxalis oulophora]